MSTILKSLKRLEKEKEDLFVQQHVSFSSFDTRETMSRTVRFEWLKNRALKWGIIVVILVVGIAGLYAYTRPTEKMHKIHYQATSSAPASVTKHQAAPPQQIAAKRPLQQDSTGVQKVVPRKALSHVVNPPARAKKPRPMAIPKSSKEFLESGQYPQVELPKVKLPHTDSQPPQIEKSRVASKSKTVPTRTLEPKPSLIQNDANDVNRMMEPEKAVSTAVSRNEASNGDSANTKNEDSLYVNAERMTDGRLKVQAIVWAPDAKERMAVVNNRVVREGATIENFLVVGIGEDALYVREEGMRLMKVSFGQP